MWFTRISIGNPVLTTMMMAALLVLGLFSWQRLSVDQFPDFAFPIVVIQTEYPGASPETVEADISRRIVEGVNTISGIKRLGSRSHEGSSIVIVEFELNVDAAEAAREVREKIALIKVGFRREVREPRVSRFDPASSPIIWYALSSDGTLDARELTAFADRVVKKRLENVGGVGSVSVVGGVARQIQIRLKPEQMEARAIGVDLVLNALRNENQELPAGAIHSSDRELVVQVTGRIKVPEEFSRIIVARRAGQAVTIGDVAEVVDSAQEPNNRALIDGRPTLALSVLKAQSQNAIDAVDRLGVAVTSLKTELPARVRIEVVRDTTDSIRKGVKNVERTIIEGALLTELQRLSTEAMRRFAQIPGMVDIDSSLKSARPTVAVSLRRELAADLGVGVAQVGAALRPLLAGDAATTWRAPDDENIDVVVRLAAADRDRVSDLNRLMLSSSQTGADGNPKMIALRQIADISTCNGASQINRSDLSREVQIQANVYGRAAGAVGRDVEAALKGMDFKPGYRYVIGGSTRDMQDSAAYAASALVLLSCSFT